MVCFGAKFAYGVSLAALAAAAVAAIPAAPTVVGEVAVIGAFLAAGAAHIAAAIALAECLEDAGRGEDGAALRPEVDELRRALDRLRELTGAE